MKMNDGTVVLDFKSSPLVGSCDTPLEVVEVLDLVTSLQVALNMNMNDDIDTNSPLVGSCDDCDVTLEVVDVLNLDKSLQVTAVDMTMNDEIIVVDANSPLVGSSSACDVTLEVVDVLKLDTSLQIMNMNDEIVVLDATLPMVGNSSAYDLTLEVLMEEVPSWKFEYHSPETAHLNSDRYEVCTFGLGCFWSAELAFQRVPGVVGTKVGYSQGFTINPTYEQVCTGSTHHREAVQVVFDTTVTSFPVLLQTALERLAAAVALSSSSSSSFVGAFQLFDTEEEKLSPSKQYHHGVYYHTDEQRLVVEETIGLDHDIYEIELLPAKIFYTAEESHQKYLLKGGQCARKGATEPIRCYG